jgi:restriction endonuclease S subunit
METITTNKKIDEKYLLNKGDIILKLTPPYTAQIIDFNEKNITTTSNYAIIKINTAYNPELINFYLNSEYIKKQIYYLAAETSIKVITIKNIKDFQIIEVENDKKDTYTKLIKTYIAKKELMEKQLQLEKDLLEEIIFGEK